MGWKEGDRVPERREFVRLAEAEDANMAELCLRFGVSRKTGYKWLKRWESDGESGLEDQRSERGAESWCRKVGGEPEAGLDRHDARIIRPRPRR